MPVSLMHWALTFAAGTGGALLCVWLGTPLPWLIGPLVATAALRMLGRPMATPRGTRAAGQWAIGIALGHYFQPEVVSQVLRLAPALLCAALFALALGALCSRLLRAIARVDRATAYFASMPGGASEMANLAERYGARVDQVAAAHSLRVALVVIVIPAIYVALGLHGLDDYTPGVQRVDAAGLVLLGVLTVAGAFALRFLGQPNAWMVGPLLITAALTAGGHALSALPHELVVAGQLCIGCSLGCRFEPEFLRGAPRLVAGVVAITILMSVAGALFGVLLALLFDMPVPSATLGLAPGGIAEMCLTAKALQLGVPAVTGFHVVRLLTIVMLSGPVYARFVQREAG